MDDKEKVDPVTPCMDFYKVNIQYYGSLDKLKLIIVVRGDFQNKEMLGDTWATTASISSIKYFLADAAKHKSRVHQFYFIGSFLQANVKHRVLWSWKVDMENTYQIMPTILGYH